MNKVDYLKLAVKEKKPHFKNWVISAFAVVRDESSNKDNRGEYLELRRLPWGYAFIDENQSVIKIDDATDVTKPIFTFADKITIDSSWFSNVSESIETTIGNVIFNSICIETAFGSKFPFIVGPAEVGKIENKIAVKLKDTPKPGEERSDDFYYVDEYIKFCDALQFLTVFSNIVIIAATEKNIRKPEGIEEFKAQLLKKYEGQLKNPVKLAEFEKELLDFDSKYLADDPTKGKLISGKVADIGRKKMFLAYGAEQIKFDNSPEVLTIPKSLEEGWDTEPDAFVSMMNGLRAGSFARGSETVKGGVAAKVLLRSSNNFKLIDNDCGTKLGIRRFIDEKQANNYIGRYIQDGDNLVQIKSVEDLKPYFNKTVKVRSPMYCKLPGETICRHCAGENMFKYPTGVAIPLTEISNILLYAAMKAMHGKKISSAKINLSTAIS